MKTGDRVYMVACSRCMTVRLVYAGPTGINIYCSVCEESVPVLHLIPRHCGQFEIERSDDKKEGGL